MSNYRRINKKRQLKVINEKDLYKELSVNGGTDDVEVVLDTNVTQQRSEENIPESQEYTQRFLSQHSAFLATTLGRTPSSTRNTLYCQPNTYFELALQKIGVNLNDGDNFILPCDHVTFTYKLREFLVNSYNYPENLETFKAGLSIALTPKSKYVLKLLNGCNIDAGELCCPYISHCSMYTNFLMIDCLLEPAMEILLSKIEELCMQKSSSTQKDPPLLPLMLTQLQYVRIMREKQIIKFIKQVFGKATDVHRLDIISKADLILNNHDEFMQLLGEQYSSNKEFFNNTTIQALKNFSLNSTNQETLRERVKCFVKSGECSNMILPDFVQILLDGSLTNDDSIVCKNFFTIRDIFNWRYKNPVDNIDNSLLNTDKIQLELFKLIKQSLTSNPHLFKIWQKNIVALPTSQFNYFDLMVLLLQINIKEDILKYIENVIRTRIKRKHINVTILKDAIVHCPIILKQHSNTLLHILHDFIREKHPMVKRFAKAAYIVLFQMYGSIQIQIIKKLMELICRKSNEFIATIALESLLDLQHKYTKQLQSSATLLLPLQDRLNNITLHQTRLLMKVLCQAAYPPPQLSECTEIQEQLHILVKKQLHDRSTFIKKQGIIGVAQLIGSIIYMGNAASINTEDEITRTQCIEGLPNGRPKLAANLFIQTETATVHCPESLAFFYNELSNVLTVRHNNNCSYLINIHFLRWLCEIKTDHLQFEFLVEYPETYTMDGISLQNQKCIIEQLKDGGYSCSGVPIMSVNVSKSIISSKYRSRSSILVLPPLFNVLCILLRKRFKNSLESVNALLGWGFIVPSFFDTDNYISMFNSFNEEQKKNILDIYFHTANWLRVLICAFITQIQPVLHAQVLQRLLHLTKVEKQIKLLLSHAPANYLPPLSQFLTNPSVRINQVQPKPREIAHTKDKSLNVTRSIQCHKTYPHNVSTKSTTSQYLLLDKINFDDLYGPKETFRAMDATIMLFLKETFRLSYPLELEYIGLELGLQELRFVLTDLMHKFETIIETESGNDDYLLQYSISPENFMADFCKFLPDLNKLLSRLGKSIESQKKIVNNVSSHLDLFKNKFNYIKVCFELSIRIVFLYFSWSEWRNIDKFDMLLLSLSAFFPKEEMSSKKSISYVSSKLFICFLGYGDCILVLSTAVQLYQLLESLNRLNCAGESAATYKRQKEDLRELCKKFLNRKWYHYSGALEKGAKCNSFLDKLIKGYLKDSSTARQTSIISFVKEECHHLNTKEVSLKSFPNIKKQNFPLLYRGLCEILISQLTTQLSTDVGKNTFKLWESNIELLNELLYILNTVNHPRNFILFLKHSYLFLKLLLDQGWIVLEASICDEPQRFAKFMGKLQNVTRFIHSLLCHSKTIKNTNIMSYIPVLRETHEILLFRVKALLAAANCSLVFNMGVLLNKDLHGQKIITPACSFATILNETGSEEEIPEDDETLLDHETIQLINSRNKHTNNQSRKD